MVDVRVPPDIACTVLEQKGWSDVDIDCLNDRRSKAVLPCAREVADTHTGYAR